jgi:hypothetical protein
MIQIFAGLFLQLLFPVMLFAQHFPSDTIYGNTNEYGREIFLNAKKYQKKFLQAQGYIKNGKRNGYWIIYSQPNCPIFLIILEAVGKDGVKDGLNIQKAKWNQVLIDSNDKYKITNEGKTYYPCGEPTPEAPTPVGPKKSSLIVNNDTSRTILFTKAKLKGDTLEILIHHTDPAYHHKYLITIVKGKYFIKYTFKTSGVQEKRTIIPLETKLKLKSSDFKKGKEIRGYTEYKGECTEGCWEKLIQIKGNFSVVIQ